MQILQNVLHSLTKRKKQAGKVTVTAAVAAVFIAAIVVSANGILSYQKAVTKKTFGGWFIMENSSNGTQSEELKTHPYLAGSGKGLFAAGKEAPAGKETILGTFGISKKGVRW